MFSNIGVSNSYRKGVDWLTVILYILLVAFGWSNLYAANYNPEVGLQFSLSSEYFKQLMWIGVSAVFAGIIMLSDSKLFVEAAWPIYGASLVLLTLVLLIGKEVYGAKSWLAIGPIQFQPAEFTKIGAALVISRLMSRYGFRFDIKQYATLAAVILVPVGYILLQNDTGSALVYFVFLLPMFREGLTPHILLLGTLCLVGAIAALLLGTWIAMLSLLVLSVVALQVVMSRQGHSKTALIAIIIGAVVGGGLTLVNIFMLGSRYPVEFPVLIGLAVVSVYLIVMVIVHRLRNIWLFLLYVWVGVGTSFAAGFVFEHVLIEHQRTRINVLFGIEDDPLGAGYNVNQSMIAIGSGGLLGKGFLAGTQTKLNFVPKQTTDFIFCTVGEEWGFIGSLALVGTYLFFFLRLIHLAEQQHSVFSRVYGYCVACVFFFHFTINICMTIGLMPVIGIPLPFFSYGGSSLWGFSVMLFIFLKLDTDRNFLIR